MYTERNDLRSYTTPHGETDPNFSGTSYIDIYNYTSTLVYNI